MHPLIKALINLIFPQLCIVCGKRLADEDKPYICSKCWSRNKLIQPPYCPRCGQPLLREVSGDPVCNECRRIKYHFRWARAAGIYEGVLKEAIHLLKYRGVRTLVDPLGDLMIEHLRSNGNLPEFDLILPVPLHRAKLRQREFNQAAGLARRISKYFEIPVSTDNLQQIRSTKSQTKLTKAQRIANVKGTFRVKRADELNKKSVLLIDDVFTTGATVDECSKVLLAAGAKEVFVMTLARGA